MVSMLVAHSPTGLVENCWGWLEHSGHYVSTSPVVFQPTEATVINWEWTRHCVAMTSVVYPHIVSTLPSRFLQTDINHHL